MRNVGGKSFILLDYFIDAPKLRKIGVEPSRHAPPAAVIIASAKFWARLQTNLQGIKAPAPRKRSKQEIDA